MAVPRCEHCKGVIRKGRRFCTVCAVNAAKRWNLDYFDTEPDPEEIDLIAQYEHQHKVKALIAAAIIAVIGAMALWAVTIA